MFRNGSLAVAVAVALALAPASAGMARNHQRPRHTALRRHHHHHRRAVAHEVTVTPSEAIEQRVESETLRAEDVLEHLGPDNLFASPYLTSAIVYHDGFLGHFPREKATADPSRRIIAHLTSLVTPDVKKEYVELLRRAYAKAATADAAAALIQPVSGYFVDVRHLRRNHHDALDLFVAEGSPVRAASAGIVILADAGWDRGDPFAVTSLRGGNAVVVFDPAANRFYRYCHLASVVVSPGTALRAGQMIGRVGHTGYYAERSGHGEHLHFEVNQYAGGNVRALDYRELLALVNSASPAPANADQLLAGLPLLPIL